MGQAAFWFEFLRTIFSTITAGAAAIGVWIAIKGINRWRAETIGKLRIELAEGTLAEFYEARDIIQAARSPLIRLGEGSTRELEDWEKAAPPDYNPRDRDALYASAERLEKRSEFFAKLNARRYRFIAHFGPEAAKPFDEIRRVHDEIIQGAHNLIWLVLGPPVTDEGWASVEQWRATVKWPEAKKGERQPEDHILKRLN